MLWLSQIRSPKTEINAYLLIDQEANQSVLIHAPDSLLQIEEEIQKQRVGLLGILLTQGSLLLAARAAELRTRYQAWVGASKKELSALAQLPREAQKAGLCGVHVSTVDKFLSEGDEILLGSKKIRVLETPGPSPGHVVFIVEENFFVGTLFQSPKGEIWDKSLERLLTLVSSKSRIYPAFGPVWNAVQLSKFVKSRKRDA